MSSSAGTLEVPVLKSVDQLQDLLGKAQELGFGVMVMFKKEFCRKCAAMAPKFERLAHSYTGHRTIWVELIVDGLTKDFVKSWGIKAAPTVLYIDKDGARLELYEAMEPMKFVLNHIEDMMKKYSAVLEEGTTIPSLADLLGVEVQSSARAPMKLTRTESRAGAILAAKTRAARRLRVLREGSRPPARLGRYLV